MWAQRVKTWITTIGAAMGLGFAAWAMYLDIASGGKDPTVMRWFGAALGMVVLSWVLGWIMSKRARHRSGRPTTIAD